MTKKELRKQILKGKNIGKIVSSNLEQNYYEVIDVLLETVYYLMRVGSSREVLIENIVEEIKVISKRELSVEQVQILFGLVSKFEINWRNEIPSATRKKWEKTIKKLHEIASFKEEELVKACQLRLLGSGRSIDMGREKLGRRVDYLKQQVITIDGSGSKCLDDGLYLEKCDDGTFNLYVHITDIPSVVSYDSEINASAFRFRESWYLPGIAVPMLPEDISYDISSLQTGTWKDVLTYKVKVDANYDVLDDTFEIVMGRIRVSNNFTYQQVDDIINGSRDDGVSMMLRDLSIICSKLRWRNVKKNKYRELENLLKGDRNANSARAIYSSSANIVQEMMILVNHLAAEHFKKIGFPFIYRVNVNETGIGCDRWLEQIFSLDLSLSDFEKIRQQVLKSYYSSVPEKHEGLGLSTYSHLTSAGRRYSDSYNQYLTHCWMGEEIFDKDVYRLEELTQAVVYYLNNTKGEFDKQKSSETKKILQRTYKKTEKWKEGKL